MGRELPGFVDADVPILGAHDAIQRCVDPFRPPVKLHPNQAEFVADDRFELFDGGAAGSGKTVAQPASAAKYAHVSGYSAIILREHYSHSRNPPGSCPRFTHGLQPRHIGPETRARGASRAAQL